MVRRTVRFEFSNNPPELRIEKSQELYRALRDALSHRAHAPDAVERMVAYMDRLDKQIAAIGGRLQND